MPQTPLNVVNDQDLTAKFTATAEDLHSERLTKWVVKQFSKVVRESRDLLVPFTTVMATAREWPGWVYQKLEEGAELFLFPDRDDNNPARAAFDMRLGDVITFLATLQEFSTMEISPTDRFRNQRQTDKDAAFRILDDIAKKKLEAIEELMESWSERIERRRVEQDSADGNSSKVLDLPDGVHSLVRLNTLRALDEESAMMGNCVGSGRYDKEFEAGVSQFLSVRDGSNRAHVTIQVKNRELHEFRGRNNRPPKDKYRNLLGFVFNSLNLPPTSLARTLLNDLKFVFYSRGAAGKRYGEIFEVAPVVYEAGQYKVHRLDQERSEMWYVRGPTEVLTAEIGDQLHLSGAVNPVTFELLTEATGLLGKRLPPPSVSAASQLSAFSYFYSNGRYGHQIEFAEVLHRFTNGHAMRRLVNEESKQEMLFYVDARNNVLGTFTIRYRADVDRNRLYVVSLTDGFVSPETAANMTVLLNEREIFLSDAVTASKLGIVFCRLKWRYMPMHVFWETINLELMERDMRAVVERDEEGHIQTSLHLFLRRLGNVDIVPMSDKSPFHIISQVRTNGIDDRQTSFLVYALNQLMFPSPKADLGDPRIGFDKKLYAYAVKRRSRVRPQRQAPPKKDGLITRISKMLGLS
jgi:hypothetical protein